MAGGGVWFVKGTLSNQTESTEKNAMFWAMQPSTNR